MCRHAVCVSACDEEAVDVWCWAVNVFDEPPENPRRGGGAVSECVAALMISEVLVARFADK